MLSVESKPQVAGGARVDDSPAFPLAGTSAERRGELSVDENEIALAARHLLHRGGCWNGAGGIEGDVGNDEHALSGGGNLLGVPHDNGPIEATEYLISNEAVVMRVVPVHAWRVVGWQLITVVEGVAGVDRDEHVIAIVLRRDVQAVHVQVARFGQSISQADIQDVASPNAQGGAGHASVVTQRTHIATGNGYAPRRRLQGDRESTVGAA